MFRKRFLIQVVSPLNKILYEYHNTYHKGDSGLDLFIIKEETIAPGETKLIDLGIRCQSKSLFNYHSYWMVPRSSVSKTPLLLRNSIGLIDAAYTGNLKAAFYNTSDKPFTLNRGERYVQLVNNDLSPALFEIVDVVPAFAQAAPALTAASAVIPLVMAKTRVRTMEIRFITEL